MTPVFLLVLIFVYPGYGQETQASTLFPKVLMLDFGGVTESDEALFRAIRAHLSSVPLRLGRIALVDKSGTQDPIRKAKQLAEDYRASMIFWVEDDGICVMLFYIPDKEGGQINGRTLDIESGEGPNRHEIIAIAVSSMVEGLLVSRRLKPPPPQPKPPKPVVPTAPKMEQRRQWSEITFNYAGSLFAEGVMMNGVQLGIGVLPIERLVVAAAFTQNLRTTLDTDGVRLSLMSRMITISMAGRVLIRPVEIRLGLSWLIELRTFSVSAWSSQLIAEPDGFRGIHGIMPFVSMAWLFSENIGIVGRLGANFCLNETNYAIEFIDGQRETVLPYVAKFNYHLGLIIRF